MAASYRPYPPEEKAARALAPPISGKSLRAMSGIEAMQALAAGRYHRPPILDLLDGDLVEVSEGRAVFVIEPQATHLNPLGIVHGGIALTLLDSCTGCAAHTVLPAGVGYTTLETKVSSAPSRPIPVRSTPRARSSAQGARSSRPRDGLRTRRVVSSRTVRRHFSCSALKSELGLYLES